MARQYALVIGLTGALLTGCSLQSYQHEFSQSLAAWNRLKAENSDNYRYEVQDSVVSGPETLTTLTVRDGKVVTRSYTSKDVYSSDEDVNVSWTETGTEVGNHLDQGAAPITLDARYERCQNDVLSQSSITNEITLDFLSSGVLSVCYSVPKNVIYDGGAEVLTKLEFLSNKD